MSVSEAANLRSGSKICCWPFPATAHPPCVEALSSATAGALWGAPSRPPCKFASYFSIQEHTVQNLNLRHGREGYFVRYFASLSQC